VLGVGGCGVVWGGVVGVYGGGVGGEGGGGLCICVCVKSFLLSMG